MKITARVENSYNHHHVTLATYDQHHTLDMGKRDAVPLLPRVI